MKCKILSYLFPITVISGDQVPITKERATTTPIQRRRMPSSACRHDRLSVSSSLRAPKSRPAPSRSSQVHLGMRVLVTRRSNQPAPRDQAERIDRRKQRGIEQKVTKITMGDVRRRKHAPWPFRQSPEGAGPSGRTCVITRSLNIDWSFSKASVGTPAAFKLLFNDMLAV